MSSLIINRDLKLLFLNALKNGYFNEDGKTILKTLFNSVSTNLTTAQEQISQLRSRNNNLNNVKQWNGKATQDIKHLILKGLKRGYFNEAEKQSFSKLIGASKEITIVIVSSAKEKQELDLLEK